MTDPQENKLTMFYALIKLIEKMNALWAANVPFATTFGLFKGKVGQIETQRNTQLTETKGSAKDKEAKREALIKKAYFIAARIQSYAATIGNVDLLEGIKYTKSDFKRRRDTELTGLATIVLAKANANAAALVAYSVSAAVITDLQTALTAYNAVISSPRAAIVGTKYATSSLEILFKEATALLTDRLDKDILVYEISNPEFFKNYNDARKIIGTATSKKALVGFITEGTTDIPVSGAKITITNKAEKVKPNEEIKSITIEKKSTKQGRFQLVNLTEGPYQVQIEKLGYVPQTISVNIIEGETASVEVGLETV